MTPLPKIIYGQGEGLGAGILIYNQPLPIVGRIIQYKSLLDMQENLNALAYSVVPGYSIAILYAGILGRGNVLMGNKDALEQIQPVLDQLASWYLKEKILPHKSRFKRFQI